jgi:transposase
VYWIPLFELLESRGFKVLLINARHVKNVSGRKSDVLDCQWIVCFRHGCLISSALPDLRSLGGLELVSLTQNR